MSFYYQTRHLVKQVILCVLRALPFSSEYLGPPAGIYSSAAAWWAEVASFSGKEDNPAAYQVVHEASTIERSVPNAFEQPLPDRFEIKRTSELDSTFVARIPEGRLYVDGNAVAVITPEDRIVANVSLDFGQEDENHPVLSRIKLPTVEELSGTNVALSAPGGIDTYYHWLLDELPRIGLLRCAGYRPEEIDHYLVSDTRHRYQRESLNVMGIPSEKVISAAEQPHTRSSQLVVPSLVSKPDYWARGRWVYEFLRSRLLGQVETTTGNTPSRIYVSRDKASRRRVDNEMEVVDVLKKWGFERVFLEDLSFTDQVCLFANADCVAAPHGSALANLTFCREKTRIIEFFAPRFVNVCFWSIADFLELDYYFLLGEELHESTGYDGQSAGVLDDIQVPIETLERMVDRIISER